MTKTSATAASDPRWFSEGSSVVLFVSSLGKMQRVFALLLLGAVVLLGFVALYSEFVGRQSSRTYSHAHFEKPTWFKLVTSTKKQNSESWRTSFTPQSWKPEYMGQANLHVFEDWCGSLTDDLRRNVHYPLHPHVRTTVKKLAVAPQQTNYGLRIFGYLHPFTDGEFVFALSSDDNSEFWLSTDDSPLNLQVLAWVGKTGAEWTVPGEFDKFIHQISTPVRLSAQTKYFFEVIHKQNAKGLDHVAVAWRLWDQAQHFVFIQSDHISLYVNEYGKVLGDFAHIPQTVASHSQSNAEEHSPTGEMQREDPRDTFYQVPLISNTSLRGVLPDCSYKPSYTIKGYQLQRYQGLKFVHLSYIYPNDHTRMTHREPENACYYSSKSNLFHKYINMDIPDVEEKKVPQNNKQMEERKSKWSQTFEINSVGYQAQKSDTLNMDCTVVGNILLQEAEVRPIVEGFMEKFNKKHSGLFTLGRVINVEMNADAQKGKRYLLELELNSETGEMLRLSHYIYDLRSDKEQQELPKLCNPVGFSWNPQATVHFVIPVKNQAKWVHLLIDDIEKLVRESGDANFNLILIDFDSTDINIKEALEKSKIPRYQYKKLKGNFERSRGLQEGVNLISDPHSIMFLFDLHIRFPSSIIDTIRKHCIEGYQAFAPIVVRMDCGSTPSDARGFWEVQGFGLVGIYKSDLDSVGGMNTREFKDRWGGEDWELLDRILMAGLEVERIYLRNFYHHFHSKRGMWQDNQS